MKQTVSALALSVALLSSHALLAFETYSLQQPFPKSGGLARVSNFSGCSASVFAFDDYEPSDKALVLTNGHCIGLGDEFGMYPDSDDVFINVSEHYTSVDVYKDDATLGASAPVESLAYATMNRLDIAVYQLKATYSELKSFGLTPLILSRNPDLGENQIYIMPSTYWALTRECQFLGKVDKLVEGPWTWQNSLRFSRENCQLIGGMSGSPILDGKNEIIGVMNTTNEGGDLCSLGNPCEVNGDEPTALKHMGYGSPVSELYNCRNAKGEFDPLATTCKLPRSEDK